MFSRMVPENSEGSWNTAATPARRTGTGSSSTSAPNTSTAPECTGYSPINRLANVDLPPPDSPTSATFSPCPTWKEMPRSTSGPSSYPNVTSRNATAGTAS